MSTPRAVARKALRLAIEAERTRGAESYADVLAVAYMRLLVARTTGSGVRLTADEVESLFVMDNAILCAAENIAEEFVPTEDDA